MVSQFFQVHIPDKISEKEIVQQDRKSTRLHFEKMDKKTANKQIKIGDANRKKRVWM